MYKFSLLVFTKRLSYKRLRKESRKKKKERRKDVKKKKCIERVNAINLGDKLKKKIRNKLLTSKIFVFLI